LRAALLPSQVVLAHASEFVASDAGELDITENIPKNAFKWLQLADAANLPDACKACVDRIVGINRTACKVDALQGLSPQTLMYMVEKMAGAAASCSKPTKIWQCSGCRYNNNYCCRNCAQY
jgi:hypothetical protein